ncbi:MAG: DUF721 domain-containing protein [Alphaproteobacteria bacterium]|jgi:hypothetical protein|nr:DUF721 domain-containing protein [Alphaproteobacteria bacterium]
MKKDKRYYKLLPLSESLSRIYKKNSKNNDYQFLNLIKNWDKIVGKEYSKILKPIKVISKTSSLVVMSDRNFSLEAKYISPMLIEKINIFYGYKSFKKIEFVFKDKSLKTNQKPIIIPSELKNKIEEKVCNIENDDLKIALERLGKSMAKRGKLK